MNAMCYNECRGDKIENKKSDSYLNVCGIIGNWRIHKNSYAVLPYHAANPFHNSCRRSSRWAQRSDKCWDLRAVRSYGRPDFYGRRRNFLRSLPDIRISDRIHHVTGKICYAGEPTLKRLLLGSLAGYIPIFLIGTLYDIAITFLYLKSDAAVFTVAFQCLLPLTWDVFLCVFTAFLGKRLIPIIHKGEKLAE